MISKKNHMMEEKAEHFFKALQPFISSFFQSFDKTITELNIVISPKVYNNAYRYVLLSEGLDGLGINESQLDWSRVSDPYISWAKSELGAKKFLETKIKNSKQVIVVVKGSILGYELVEVAKTMLGEAESFFENELTPFFAKNYNFNSDFFQLSDNVYNRLKYRIDFVRESIALFKEEEEIIALEVNDWQIVDKFEI